MLRAGWSKDQILVGARDFSLPRNVLTSSRAHPARYAMVNKVLAWGKEGMKLATHFHLVPKLRVKRAKSLHTLYTFMAWAGTTLPSPFAMTDATSAHSVNYLIILLLKSNQNTQVSRWFSFCRGGKKKYSMMATQCSTNTILISCHGITSYTSAMRWSNLLHLKRITQTL